MAATPKVEPENIAVRVALWRALHVLADAPRTCSRKTWGSSTS
jgi:hypothetical protein